MVLFDQITLPNGLRVIGERLPHFRSVAVGVWIAAGSQYETKEENGLSHFLEHMLFKGTDRRSARQIAEEMDAVGGQLNAFTAKDCTCFYAKVIDEHTALALDILSDMIKNAAFDEVELNKEKGVVLEEIAMSEDEPEDLCGDLIMTAHYGDQPLAWPILGPADNVRAFDRARLVKYRDSHYRPERAVLAVAGNYDWAKLLDMVGTYFGDWTRGDGVMPVCRFGAHAPGIERRAKDIEQTHLTLGYTACEISSPKRYALSIVNSVLGGAMSSRLFQRIREESGMAYSVYSYPAIYMPSGMLAVYAGFNPGNADTVLSQIDEEVKKLSRDGLTRDEFEKTRAQLRGSYVLGRESASARMNDMGRRLLLLGDTQTEDEALACLGGVTWNEVNDLARDVLSGPRSQAWVGPEK